MIAIWAGLIAGCLAAIPWPCQICERGRLPQTHVFIKVTVSRMGWARRRSRLRGSSCTIVRILIRAICAISFSVAFPVVVDAQVICFAVKLVAGTRCSACWNWRVASLKRWHLFKSLVQTYKFFTPSPQVGIFEHILVYLDPLYILPVFGFWYICSAITAFMKQKHKVLCIY